MLRRVRDLRVGDRLVFASLCESDHDKAQKWLAENRDAVIELDERYTEGPILVRKRT